MTKPLDRVGISMDDLFTTGQIAKLCRVAPRTATRWIDAGALEGYRIPLSQDRRVTRSNLIRFLKAHGMPLYDLETAGQFHVITVGLQAFLGDKLTKLLPGSAGFYWQHPDSGLELGMLLSESPMDALLIDLAGNRGEGLHVLRRLRTMPEYARLEIIGLASEDETADIAGERFSSIYQRPFDVASLADWLRTLARMKWGLDGKPAEVQAVRSRQSSRNGSAKVQQVA